MAGMARLFVAAWPSPELRDGLIRLRSLIGRGVSGCDPPARDVTWVSGEHWHITLQFLGEADPDIVSARLREAVLPRVTVDCDPRIELWGRGDRHLVVAPVHGAEGLAAAVRSATDGLGCDEVHDFRGHITLARTRRGAHRRLAARSASISDWPVIVPVVVTEIALVASELAGSRPAYRTITTVPVNAGCP